MRFLEHRSCALPITAVRPASEHAAPRQLALGLGELHVAPSAHLHRLGEVALGLRVTTHDREQPAQEARRRFVHREPVERDLIVIRLDETNEVLGRTSGGELCSHSAVHRDRVEPGGVGKHPVKAVLGSHLEQDQRLLVLPSIQVARGHAGLVGRDAGVLLGDLGNQGGELVHSPLLYAHDDQLCAVEREGVGLRALGADLEGQGGQLLGAFVVSDDEGLDCLVIRRDPDHHGLAESLGQRLHDLKMSGAPCEVTLLDGGVPIEVCGPEQSDGVVELPGEHHGAGAGAQSIAQHARNGEGYLLQVEHVDEGGGVPEPFGHVGRLASELQSPIERSVGELAAQCGEQHGAIGAVAVRGHLESRFEDRHPLVVHDTEGAEEPPVVGQGRADQAVSIAQPLGEVGGLKEGLPEGRDAGLSLGDTA